MLSNKLFKIGVFILLLSLSFTVKGNAPVKFENERQKFQQAEKALSQGNFTLYHKLKRELSNYPLYPYLLYAEHENNIGSLTYEVLQDFITDYNDSPLSEQLRTRFLNAKAKEERWHDFLKAYQPTNDLSVQCYRHWAALQTSNQPSQILKEIQPIWLSGKETPKSCEAPFRIWEKSGQMTRALIWQRIKAAIQLGNAELARQMSLRLKKPEQTLVDLWLMVHANPTLVTQQKYFKKDHPASLEILVDGVAKIAKNNPESAIKIWKKMSHDYPFSERHWGLVVRAIGLSYAFQRHPDAEKWLSKVPTLHVNQAVHEWRIRVALAKQDWQGVLKWMKDLPPALQTLEEWQYWRGRALEKVSRVEEGNEILEKLAKSRSYYGFLASLHLTKPFSVLQPKITFDKELVRAVAFKAAVLRAKELYSLGRYQQAKNEWQFVTQRMSEQEKHAAASLALHWELPNWSILALTKAENKNDLTHRFPVVYSQHVMNQAQQHTLDPAWIFAVTRQESAFVPHAKSPAGALGLMQLMPNTAELVAKKHRIPLGGIQHILEPNTNIKLGSSYLRMMLDCHDNNTILATASYNAGPARVKKWLPTFDMAADIWVETIPYKETRDYVKNVMTYTAIYQEILGRKPKSRKMPHIRALKEG
jgi:soluble lytic murein transglycosylase